MSSATLLSELASMQQRAEAVLAPAEEGVASATVPQAVHMALANKLSTEQVLRGQYRTAKEAFDKAVLELEQTQERHEAAMSKPKELALLVRQLETQSNEMPLAVTSFAVAITDAQCNNYNNNLPTVSYRSQSLTSFGAQYQFLRAVEQERYLHWLILAQRDIVAATQAEATLFGQKLLATHTEIKQLEDMIAGLPLTTTGEK
jgi:hypothetical protein